MNLSAEMKNLDETINHAEKYCESNGSRLTRKRKQVLVILLDSKIALSAYELIDLYNAKHDDGMPATTMYRILEFLENEHLVHKLSTANKYVACSHIRCDHDHYVSQFLICNKCQKVEEINISQSTISGLQKNIKEAGFHLIRPQLEMNCVCNQCQINVV